MTHRRQFITLLGGAAVAWPFMAHGEQAALPVIGWLDPRSLDDNAELLRRFRQGIKEAGFVEGENVLIEYRWAENRIDRLRELAAELVRRPVAVIVAVGATNRSIGSQVGNFRDSHCLHGGRRPGQSGPGRQPCSARRQLDWHQSSQRGTECKASGNPARVHTKRNSRGGPRESGKCYECRGHGS